MHRLLSLSALLILFTPALQAERYRVLKISDLSKVTHHQIATEAEVEAIDKEFEAESRIFTRVHRKAAAAWEQKYPDTPFPRFPQRKYSVSGTYATLEQAEERLKHQRWKDAQDSRKRDFIHARLPDKRDKREMLEEAALGMMESHLTDALAEEGIERSVFESPRGRRGRGLLQQGHMEFDVKGTLARSSSGEYYLVPSNEEKDYELPPWEMDITRSQAEGLGIQTQVGRKVIITFSAELHGHSGGGIRFMEITPIASKLDN